MTRNIGAAALAAACVVLVAPVGQALADDDTKEGMVAFFMETGCPDGWSVATAAEGRLLLGVTDSSTFKIGAQSGGDPLTNEEDRTHTHSYAETFSLGTVDIEGDSGCCNKSPASPGGKSTSGTTDAAHSGLPLAQLTVCEKTTAPTDPTADDPYPLGALSFFNAQSCPAGSGGGDPDWQPAPLGTSGLGYFVVPFFDPPAATLAALVGTGLTPGENLQHRHFHNLTIDIDSLELIAKWGCAPLGLCTGLTTSGNKPFLGLGDYANSSIPYLTLMLCQKAAFSPSSNPPQDVPEAVVSFFTDQACPTGWKMTEATTGRYLVGLPSGGIPGATFGGEPLEPTESVPTPIATHAHDMSGSITTGYKEVILGSGSGADNVGKDGTYTYKGPTNPHAPGFPYMGVIQCQPCTANDPDKSCQTQ